MKYIIFSTLLLFSSFVFSQTSYTYDDSGNRTGRTIVLPKNSQSPARPDEPALDPLNEPDEHTDRLGDFSFNIYPNPTKGEVLIKSQTEADGSISVYDMHGRLIYEHKGSLADNKIDLYRYKTGIYFLKIQSDGKEVNWKIVKE